MASPSPQAWDYVVVGAGAGGGTLAARLAEAGARVCLLDAGGDPNAGAMADSGEYAVPAFHTLASEDPAISWNYYVEHYADPAAQARDRKRQPGGVLYPRASGLGGCTAHNAMIFLRPHPDDWNSVARLTGDASWHASRMERFYRKVEACGCHPLLRWMALFGINPSGHGWKGWLSTERACPSNILEDNELLFFLLGGTLNEIMQSGDPIASFAAFIERQDDPNDLRNLLQDGVRYTPLSTRGHARVGARERVLDVQARRPDRLHIEPHALASRILFDDAGRAAGVEYLKGERLYGACPQPGAAAGEVRQAMAAGEVILAAGAFNSPQLLMLSGVGPKDHLAALGAPCRVDLPGVGRNLQDRYEIGVVNRMSRDWRALEGARFAKGDPLYQQWARTPRDGMYVSNGAAMAFIRRSQAERREPDVFAMALLAKFCGYYPGYSRDVTARHDYLTWAILKAHTRNRAGIVTLKSLDPRAPPAINFNYFDPADDPDGEDLKAVVEAIQQVRKITEPLKHVGLIAEEESPGESKASFDDLASHVRDNAWGHHACGTCAIGPRDQGGVLDADFRVHGAPGLRVVDASVFPRIPGFFIASAIYMVAEKAAEVILRQRKG